MVNRDIILKRLALIKYLYSIGFEQSKQSEIIASFSILSFHDSVEMYLKLLAEHLDIRTDKFNFLDYWNSIDSLTLKESMRNLNERRVNIKHKGLLPSRADIEISRVNTTDFFEQNTPVHFGVDFKEVSLLALIQYTTVREHLEAAQTALENNKFADCIELVAIAFDELISSYEDSKSSQYGSSPFYFGKDLTFLSSFHIGFRGDDRYSRNLGNFVDAVKESLEGIQRAVKIMSLGIEYKKFVKFKMLTPVVTKTMGGKRVAEIWGKKKWSKENCQYCIDFVLDSALKLQEFEFDIRELIEHE